MNNKTPQYTKDAINRYNSKFDRIAVNLPKGTKERIKELTGMSCNAYISELVLKDLEQREKEELDMIEIIREDLITEAKQIEKEVNAANIPDMTDKEMQELKKKLDEK